MSKERKKLPSRGLGHRFDDQMLEVCREEAAEERAYLDGNELQ